MAQAPIEETEDNSFFMRRTEVHCRLAMRILVMCFQMGRNQPGFAIASIRLHLIFKETSEQKFIPRSRLL